MEDILQRVFAVIFAVVVFFVMPIYMTFEKRDDISYALALKITTNFVNKVKAKGYLTADMYADYVVELGSTNNVYEIKMEHKRKVYNPVINVYDSKAELVDTLDYEIYKDEFAKYSAKESWRITAKGYDREDKVYTEAHGNSLKLTYKLGEIIYTEEQILEFLNQEVTGNYDYFKMGKNEYISIANVPSIPITYEVDNRPIYKMSNGDEFNVIIRNTNMTIASVLFDTLTFSGISSDMPRIYINYGCIVKNQEYTELSN